MNDNSQNTYNFFNSNKNLNGQPTGGLRDLPLSKKKQICTYYFAEQIHEQKNNGVIFAFIAFQKEQGVQHIYIDITAVNAGITEDSFKAIAKHKVDKLLANTQHVPGFIDSSSEYSGIPKPGYLIRCPLDEALSQIPDDFLKQVRDGQIALPENCCFDNFLDDCSISSCSIL